MSFAEDYMRDYRVKFVDIRVNPPGGRRRRGDASARRCEHKGCDDIGVCKAPKPFAARTIHVPGQRVTESDDSHWFCQRHAAEYNQSYDFFEGMTEAEITDFQASAGFGHKPTWRFGGGPVGGMKSGATFNPKNWRGARDWLYNGHGGGDATKEGRMRDRTRLQIRALDELNLPHNAGATAIRERYGVLVKQFHPDSNGGDRSMEYRLAIVIRAFKALKASGLA
jgi:hypothetical protein